LLDVPQYNFNWQTLYKLKDPLFLPNGTKLLVTAHYDNSEKNRYNPDPAKEVRFGDPTYDEMMIGYFDFVSAGPGRSSLKLDARTLDSYSGDYQRGPAFKIGITRRDDHLILNVLGMDFGLRPESETRFTVDLIDALVTFVKDGNGEVSEVVVRLNTMNLRARRVR
jgi:hypothetical protein